MDLGAPELLIILVIVLLLFGVGRLSKIGGELGSAVANFRKGLQEGGKGGLMGEDTPQKSEAEKLAEVKNPPVA